MWMIMRAIKQLDVVISAVGIFQLDLQHKIIAAIKEAGNVKRFFPSEFGNDVHHTQSIEPAKSVMETNVKVRRQIEAAGIPYTYLVCNYFAGYSTLTLFQLGASAPPRDKVVTTGDGNVKVICNVEQDIASYTIKTVDGPRTLNKTVYISPPKNIYTSNELVALWEKKIGKTLEKEYLSDEQILKQIQESLHPVNVLLAIQHAIIVKGSHTYLKIEPSFEVEASELYPNVKYTTVEEYLDRLV